MDCGKAVTVCDVRGCEQTVRRVEMDEHIAKNQMRHFSLMNKDRQNLLWNILQGVRWIVTNTILTWKSSKKNKQTNKRIEGKEMNKFRPY